MMEINANVTALAEKIQKLRDLRTECAAVSVAPTTLSGSGLSIDTLALIDQEYDEIKTAMLALLDNSISFFSNVKTSMVIADRKASNQILLK